MFRKVFPAAFALVVLTGASTAAEAQRRPRPPQPPRAEQERGRPVEQERRSQERRSQERRSQERGRADSIPRRYMPPPGMCRIWLDDVPPNQQPAPTDCPTAIRKRPPNGRVIFGERKGEERRNDLDLRRDLRGRPPTLRIGIPGA